ncbi:hypothetical protein GCM10009556_074930 [Acrocarpospora pleiomorpha]|uniref:toll/interleukin-1 receptor domain-containing protein n=1 Tax=Acrocarpospora pleiomorpha TaxID=90975 RepID=UPI00147886B4|nr:toll/interleukin-1 receptor domain-containing protein [Acrocarpospora pleiomorpha]
MDYDLFISHASEDKKEFVRPLADTFSMLGVDVWYDEFSLVVGDSLSSSIDKGLNDSTYGLVVISPSFIRKPWPEYEFRSLVALEVGNGKRMIPIWYNVSHEDVLRYSPRLADKFALSATDRSFMHVAVEVMRVAVPEKYTQLSRRLALIRSIQGKVEKRQIAKLAKWPVLREPLKQSQLQRIRLIRNVLAEVFPGSWESAVADFQRDHPDFREREIRIWERISGAYLSTCNKFSLTPEEKKEVFKQLLGASFGEVDASFVAKAPEWLVSALVDFDKLLLNASEVAEDS